MSDKQKEEIIDNKPVNTSIVPYNSITARLSRLLDGLKEAPGRALEGLQKLFFDVKSIGKKNKIVRWPDKWLNLVRIDATPPEIMDAKHQVEKERENQRTLDAINMLKEKRTVNMTTKDLTGVLLTMTKEHDEEIDISKVGFVPEVNGVSLQGVSKAVKEQEVHIRDYRERKAKKGKHKGRNNKFDNER